MSGHGFDGPGAAPDLAREPLLPMQPADRRDLLQISFQRLYGWWMDLCGFLYDPVKGVWADGEGPRRAGTQIKSIRCQ